MMRDNIEALQHELSRRAFFKKSIRAVGIGLFWDRFGDRLFGQSGPDMAEVTSVFSAIGNVVIPVDQDPGWATFDPGITDFALNVLVSQVLLGGNPILFQGLAGTFIAMNEVPTMIGFGPSNFLGMTPSLQAQYYGNIISGQFENYGVQDVIFLAAFVGLFATRAVFFSNYPNHLATPGAEFQIQPASPVKTGWQIMGYKGPVGPDEEKALRARYSNITVNPGMDPKNTYI
jgi:hypothetical protein